MNTDEHGWKQVSRAQRSWFTLRTLLVVGILLFLCVAVHAESSILGAPGARQAILVVTKDWDAVPGELQRFELKGDTWKRVGEPVRIVVGRKGLGWGLGLHPTNNFMGPIKKEGDGKSPAGIFNLSSAFGLADASQMKWVKLPYQHLTSVIECVDDVKSVYYNSIVDREKVEKIDWDSSEKMRDIGAQYRLGITVDHNTAPRKAGCGSCIFIHIWKSDSTGTSGCTAMTGDNMEKVLRWVDPAQHPVLVQLPRSEYERLQKTWQLPAFSK